MARAIRLGPMWQGLSRRARLNYDGGPAMNMTLSRTILRASCYNLGATLNSGQAFRWMPIGEAWEGVVGNRWVRLDTCPEGLIAEAMGPVTDWSWLTHYLQSETRLEHILATFPRDAAMKAAVRTCGGLRLLRQDPWECLASFILSSTKQIVQIRQIIEELCLRFGPALPSPDPARICHGFPSAETVAGCSERALRECKMGFRAPYLKAAAQLVSSGELRLDHLAGLPVEAARAELLRIPGVGPKIANCVLLFSYGFPEAFPIDVWIVKALRRLYFKGRKKPLAQLQNFTVKYFGPFGGYAQQYLFHYMRLQENRVKSPAIG